MFESTSSLGGVKTNEDDYIKEMIKNNFTNFLKFQSASRNKMMTNAATCGTVIMGAAHAPSNHSSTKKPIQKDLNTLRNSASTVNFGSKKCSLSPATKFKPSC